MHCRKIVLPVLQMNITADSIREYRPDDLREVERCLAELQDFSKLIYEKVADGAVAPRYLQHLLTRCGETNGRIFVAESNGCVIGMVSVYRERQIRRGR